MKKKIRAKHILHFSEGDCYQWAASIMEQFAEAIEANLPSMTEDKQEYYGAEQGIARIRELEDKLTNRVLRKKMTYDDWEDVLMYIHQEVSD